MNASEMTGMLYEVGTRIHALREIGYDLYPIRAGTK